MPSFVLAVDAWYSTFAAELPMIDAADPLFVAPPDVAGTWYAVSAVV